MSKGYPNMTALLGLLAVAGYQNRDKIASMLSGLTQGGQTATPGAVPTTPAAPSAGGGFLGSLGGLGGILGGASAGGLLSGGLGELVDRFTQGGHGATAQSWVGGGDNQPIETDQLHQALGPEIVSAIAEKTGLSTEELLSRLKSVLPEAVNNWTPQGRLPTP